MKLEISPTNTLQSGDYLIIELDTNAYSLNGSLTCYAYDCIVENQTGTVIVIRATPLSSETTLIIEGLLSSSTTAYG